MDNLIFEMKFSPMPTVQQNAILLHDALIDTIHIWSTQSTGIERVAHSLHGPYTRKRLRRVIHRCTSLKADDHGNKFPQL